MMFLKSRRTILKTGLLGASALVLSSPLAKYTFAQEGGDYILATASTGGTYYPVGTAIATLAKIKLQPGDNIGMSAISSAGSNENIKLLRDNEAQFAILQGLFGYYAWNGRGPIEPEGPQKNLRSVSMLWQNVEHFIIHSDYATTGTIADLEALKGERMSFGLRNSGTIGSNRILLENLGYNMEDDFDLVYQGYGPSAQALQNGQIAGMSTPAGVPASAVTQAFAAMGEDVTLLSFSDEQAQKADGGLELWTPYLIPPGVYPGLEQDRQTIAQPNFLSVRSDVSEDHVYKLTKTMYENLGFLQNIHSATKAMSLDAAVAGLPMPLHPGALRYYEEAGLTIPDRLRP